MTEGWVECDEEPSHRSEENEALFRERCAACPHRLLEDTELFSGLTYVKCAICTCPIGIVVHRYGNCPGHFVPAPEIP